MQKHVYRIIVLIFIFFIAIYLFGRNLNEDKVSANQTVALDSAKFPVVKIQTGDNTINLLHGYSGNINAQKIREALTPLKTDQTFTVIIDENEMVVKRIKYEVFRTNDDKLIDSDTISVLKKSGTSKSAKIKINAELEIGKEYAIKITATTNKSKKINYYTRIKVLNEGRLKEKMDFVMNFHHSILDKKESQNIAMYLETDYSKDNKSLAQVDIHSGLDAVSFGGLSPKVVHDFIPTVKEVNEETAVIELSYVISSDKTGNKKELYNVKEYYRVRYTSSRMYLLFYERTMETIFDIANASISESDLKIGITGDKVHDIVTNQDTEKMCFVRERDLWYYDLKANKAVKVFSFTEEDSDYIRDNYDQHNVKILDMDEEGNINFLVYGYMNRGDYEGRVGIVLYKFHPKDNRIEEQVYIPLEISYQVLKEDLNNFSYVNRNNVFYFTIDNNVYSYYILTNHLETVVSEVTSDSFLMSREGKFIAWQNSSVLEESKEIILLDLETGARKNITGGEGNGIKILGNMGGSLIYGLGKTKDISVTGEGNRILPMSKVFIVDQNAKVLKEYSRKNNFVVSAKVKDNIIKLERVAKNKKASNLVFKKVKSDFIVNNIQVAKQSVNIVERVTQNTLTEQYISLPSNIGSVPLAIRTSNTIITEDSTLRLEGNEIDNDKYYVYALGGVMESFDELSDAITLADEKMGTVLNRHYQIVWGRSEKLMRSSIEGIKVEGMESGSSSLDASVEMLLRFNGVNAKQEALSVSNSSVYSVLEKNLEKRPLNLIGCNLDQVLYYVSNKSPIIAMKDENEAVLIVGYDEFNIIYIDPNSGETLKLGLIDSGKMFEKAGNFFISYLN